jgi:hypothetical protein
VGKKVWSYSSDDCGHSVRHGLLFTLLNTKLNSVALVRGWTIPTERPPPVGEVSANFCGYWIQLTKLQRILQRSWEELGMKKLWYVSTYVEGLIKTIENISQGTWPKFMVSVECRAPECSHIMTVYVF